jgi:ribitol 2-dehydrogenase
VPFHYSPLRLSTHHRCSIEPATTTNQKRAETMSGELQGKVAVVTGAASGIGRASADAMLSAGARVVLADRDQAALASLCGERGEAAMPLVIDLLDPKACAALVPRALEMTGQIDILHANAGTYVGGDLVDAQSEAIDRMLHLNINVVMKNVHDVLPHMIERRTGDIIVTSSLAAHFPTPWEPVYASSKWAINCFVQTVRRQVFKHGIRVGAVSPGPVISALLADWPEEKLKEAKDSGSLIEADEVASAILFMLTRRRGVTVRDIVLMPTNFDL